MAAFRRRARAVFVSVPLLVVGCVVGFTEPSSALSIWDVFTPGSPYIGEGQPTELLTGADAIIPRFINIMLFSVGILAVVMLIYGGLRYVISGGNDSKVKDAKNTILYAIVGLIVAILGYALVNWVVANVGAGVGGGSSGSV